MYKIAIADDHRLFADGLATIIREDPELNLIFTVDNTQLLEEQIKTHNVDLLILDINIPPDNGITLLPKLQKNLPQLRVMVLSMYQPYDIDLNMDSFSGDAYVLKTSGKEVLLEALTCLKKGKKYFDPNIRVTSPLKDNFTMKFKLTKREKEIISLMAAGKSTKEIATELFLSELTVRTHRRNISEKLGTKGLSDLIYTSIRLKQLE